MHGWETNKSWLPKGRIDEVLFSAVMHVSVFDTIEAKTSTLNVHSGKFKGGHVYRFSMKLRK